MTFFDIKILRIFYIFLPEINWRLSLKLAFRSFFNKCKFFIFIQKIDESNDNFISDLKLL